MGRQWCSAHSIGVLRREQEKGSCRSRIETATSLCVVEVVPREPVKLLNRAVCRDQPFKWA